MQVSRLFLTIGNLKNCPQKEAFMIIIINTNCRVMTINS